MEGKSNNIGKSKVLLTTILIILLILLFKPYFIYAEDTDEQFKGVNLEEDIQSTVVNIDEEGDELEESTKKDETNLDEKVLDDKELDEKGLDAKKADENKKYSREKVAQLSGKDVQVYNTKEKMTSMYESKLTTKSVELII